MAVQDDATEKDTRPIFAPAARMLTWGLVLLVVGQFIYTSGQQSALEDALSGSPFSSGDGSGAMIVGAIASLIGLLLVVNGVWRLASHIDRLARHLYR